MFPSIPRLLEAVSLPFKRSQLGLFHGKLKQYGNNVPFSKNKTRRTWLPNVQRKRVYSETFDQMVRLKITTRALRSIKKAGGLDNYLAKTRHELIGLEGMRLRLAIRKHAERNTENQKAQEKAELSRTPEGQETLLQREQQELLRVHQQTVRQLQKGPTLGFARTTRELAAKALGLSGLASAQQTIEHLESRRRALATAQV
ncbi:50S ribosomal protein L24 [Amanita muscaria]